MLIFVDIISMLQNRKPANVFYNHNGSIVIADKEHSLYKEALGVDRKVVYRSLNYVIRTTAYLLRWNTSCFIKKSQSAIPCVFEIKHMTRTESQSWTDVKAKRYDENRLHTF